MYNPDDLMREELGPVGKDGKHQQGVWILEEFTSPLTQKTYKRGEFFCKPDNLIQWFANNGHPAVLDIRGHRARDKSKRRHRQLLAGY